MRMNSRIMLLAGLLLLSAALPGCRSTAPQTPPPPNVEVVSVEQRDVPITSEWVGTLDGIVNAQIRTQVSGYILRQNYLEGTIKAGDLLFEIDPRLFQAALDQARGALKQSQGSLEQAKGNVQQAIGNLAQAEARRGKTELDVKRYTPLAKKGAISQQELDDAIQANLAVEAEVVARKAAVTVAEAHVTAAQAAIESAQAAVDSAKLNLDFCKITSPIDGIAGLAQVQVGDLVGPTSGVLTTVSTVNPIKMYFTVSEQEYMYYRTHGVYRGSPGSKVPLDLVLTDGSIFPQKGELLAADRQVDVRTGAMRISALFPNPGNLLRPGQFGRVRTVLRTQQGAFLVPQRSVTELQGSYQVAIVENDNKVSIRPVRVADRVGRNWIILEGVKPGERVVAEGITKVKDGMTVIPVPFAGEEKK
jgi:RND family efflux transporter MFP subunit